MSRGRDVKTGKMIYGNHSREATAWKDVIFVSTDNQGGIGDKYEVTDVEEYIGKDRYGRGIYENDTVRNLKGNTFKARSIRTQIIRDSHLYELVEQKQ